MTRAIAVAPSLEQARGARWQLFSDESVEKMLRATSSQQSFFPLLRSVVQEGEMVLAPERMPQLLREIGLLVSGGLEIHIDGVVQASLGWFIAFCADAVEKQQPLCAWTPGRDG